MERSTSANWVWATAHELTASKINGARQRATLGTNLSANTRPPQGSDGL
jgi:hypothetical protein